MKRTLSAALSVLIFLTSFSALADTSLIGGADGPTDVFVEVNDPSVPSEWAKEYISKAADIGITDNATVLWTSNISREQFCEFAYNMINAVAAPKWQTTEQSPFSDTDNDKVIALYNAGIIEGRSDTEFAPDDSLTREEAATILNRISDYLNLSHIEMFFVFDDEEEISDWASSAVQIVCNLGVMKGVGDNKFAPKEPYTAEQAVATLVRIYDIISSTEPVVSEYTGFADKMNALMPDDTNYMFSPLSIKIALMMAANGADGTTRQEILDTINVDDIDSYNEEIKTLTENYSQSDILKFIISNSIWLNSDNTSQTFSDDYSDTMSEIFNADSGIVTNQNAVQTINDWVNKKTEGRISTIIDENNTDFWAMLINAVYFKGRWQNPFDPDATTTDIFIDRDGNESNIDFMNRCALMNYAEADGVQIVELSYQTRKEMSDPENIDISMYLLMSDDDFDPEKTLFDTELSPAYISLSVPKFNIEYSAELNKILISMGIEKAFEEDAEFNNMFNTGNMWISNVLHKTYIKVDEGGTEAAAVTSIGMAGSGMPQESIAVTYNKPFTFVIKDNLNGEILFMGEYAFADET